MSENPYAPTPPTPAANPATLDPGRTLGIVGLVLAFLIPLVGLILSIVAFNQSKRAGFTNTLARVGIIVAVIVMALGLVIGIIAGITGAMSASITYGY
jgi:hypothetical protein